MKAEQLLGGRHERDPRLRLYLEAPESHRACVLEGEAGAVESDLRTLFLFVKKKAFLSLSWRSVRIPAREKCRGEVFFWGTYTGTLERGNTLRAGSCQHCDDEGMAALRRLGVHVWSAGLRPRGCVASVTRGVHSTPAPALSSPTGHRLSFFHRALRHHRHRAFSSPPPLPSQRRFPSQRRRHVTRATTTTAGAESPPAPRTLLEPASFEVSESRQRVVNFQMCIAVGTLASFT